MPDWILDISAVAQQAFLHYGLWAVFAILLLENAGVPLPGETVLLYASYLVRQSRPFSLWALVLTAVAACTLGDNLGYWVAREAGGWLRRVLHLTPQRLAPTERYFEKYGHATIFFARFVAGLRIIAGPAAGLNRMPWRSFVVYNASGALAWVVTIVGAGYLLGAQWQHLVHLFGRLSLVLLAVAVVGIALALRQLGKQKGF